MNVPPSEGATIAAVEWLANLTPETWSAVATIATVLATIAIAVFTATLWRSTNKLWNVTQDTLRHAQRTTKQELRAYISVQPAGINPYRGIEERILGHVLVVNSGQTPARDIKHLVRLFWTKKTTGSQF